ncbi:MAG: ribulose-phosphate 3-epimerase [Tenericutes bacterium]|nr:ribulose-phosphate 3-epimerase [Mycoplasmatota bacterium]
MKIAVSFIKSKYDDITTIQKIDETSADYLHVDIMDGKFAGQKNYSVEDIINLAKHTSKLLDIHLMVLNPESYIEGLAHLNVKCITFHVEATDKVNEIIDLIHSYGIKAGISLNPETSVEKIKPYLDRIDEVLIMTVHPGKGGQTFIEEMTKKIDELNNLGDYILAVDGGINAETIKLVKKADMAISGSFICESNDYEKSIEILRG